MKLFYVFIGGGLGSMLRYSVGIWFMRLGLSTHFPWPTLGVNLLGSFLLGILFMLSVKHKLPESVHPLLMAGFMGGFTTFSAFSVEVLHLFRSDYMTTAIVYLLCSVIGGIVSATIGAMIIR